MGLTIVHKSDLTARKRNPRVALVLAGGAVTGGAYKLGGLKALDDFLVNRKTTDFDIYVGLSAGAFLAAPLAGGVTPPEMLRSLDGSSDEFTYLKVIVTGRKLARTICTTFELLDRTHGDSGTTAMARTTAFPCVVIARMLARGEFRDPGVRPLEMLAANRDAAARFELGLTARGIRWTKESHDVEPMAS